jgi:hypothetical protein
MSVWFYIFIGYLLFQACVQILGFEMSREEERKEGIIATFFSVFLTIILSPIIVTINIYNYSILAKVIKKLFRE